MKTKSIEVKSLCQMIYILSFLVTILMIVDVILAFDSGEWIVAVQAVCSGLISTLVAIVSGLLGGAK